MIRLAFVFAVCLGLYGAAQAQLSTMGVGPGGFGAGGGGGGLAYDTVTSANYNSTATGSVSLTHTPVGTPSAVAVMIVLWNSTVGTVSATYGGTSMGTAAVNASSGCTGNTASLIFGLINPGAGAKSVVISQVGAGIMQAEYAAITVTGGPTTGAVFSNTTTGSGGTATITGITSGDVVVDILACGGTLGTATGVGQTLRWAQSNGLTAQGSSATATGTSYTVSYSALLGDIDVAAFRH